MTVGQAQWQHHLGIGNLTRQATEPHHIELFARDKKIAIVRSGLIAYQHEGQQGALCFEARRGAPPPEKGAESQWKLLVEHLLRQEPTLPGPTADQLMKDFVPRVDAGDRYSRDGSFILY